MAEQAPLTSPRIGELQYSLVFGDQSALDQFWDDVTSRPKGLRSSSRSRAMIVTCS
jgi:hypothetical protein